MNTRDDDARASEHPGAGPGAKSPKAPISSSTGPTLDSSQMRARARYGILGGTFDPPHIGHLILAQEAHARLRLDRVWFVPTGAPPHKPGRAITPAADRLAMVERAIAGDARFAISTVELERPGPSYSVDTLRALRAEWGPSVELFFVLGWDMVLYLPFWHDVSGVLAAVDGLVAVHRPGFEAAEAGPEAVERLEAQIAGLREKLTLLDAPQVSASSTDIRQRVALSLPIRYLIPDTVCQYIAEHRLYRSPPEHQPGRSSPARETTSLETVERGEETV